MVRLHDMSRHQFSCFLARLAGVTRDIKRPASEKRRELIHCTNATNFSGLAHCWEWMIKIFFVTEIFSTENREEWISLGVSCLSKQEFYDSPEFVVISNERCKNRNKTVSKLNFFPCRTSKTFYWKFTAGSRRAVANKTRVFLHWIFHILNGPCWKAKCMMKKLHYTTLSNCTVGRDVAGCPSNVTTDKRSQSFRVTEKFIAF